MSFWKFYGIRTQVPLTLIASWLVDEEASMKGFKCLVCKVRQSLAVTYIDPYLC